MKGKFLLIIALATSVVSTLVLILPSQMLNTSAQLENSTGTSKGLDAMPIPDGKRMFTTDGAEIVGASSDTLKVEMVHTPKELVAGEPATFIINLFSSNGTWLWHTDYKVTIVKESNGEEVLAMPNIHGHGSMAQFTYTFPDVGKYEINVISGQQVGSPNYSGPKSISETRFTVSVGQPETSEIKSSASSKSISNTTASTVKEIPITVSSWSFSPYTIEVNKGDLVRLVFTTTQDEIPLYNGDGFGIEGYNINVFLVKGTTQTVEFEADKAGTFVFRCTSFCVADAPEDYHFNMTGTLVVNE